MSGLPAAPSELYLHPHRLALEQALAVEPGRAAAASGHATFESLFGRLPSPAGRRYALPFVSWLIVREVLASREAPWRELARQPDAVRAVQRALAELRRAGVTAGHLERGRVSPELTSLAGLLLGYERRLDELALFDDSDRERAAVLAVARRQAPALAGVRHVSVEGGASLFGARLDLLTALATTGVEVSVRLPYDPDRRPAFAWPESSLHRIEASGAPVHVRFDDRAGSGPLAPLRRAQLSGQQVAAVPVRLVEVSAVSDHARAAASVVAGWLRGGVPAHEIAIACTDLDEHGERLRHELEALGVAVRLRGGTSLGGTPAGRALVSALTLPDRGFPREPLIDLWLALGRWVETPSGRWSPERVARWLRRAGVRSTRVGGYRARLHGVDEGKRRPVDPATAEAVIGALEGLMRELALVPEEGRVLEQLEAAREHAIPLLAEAAPVPRWSGIGELTRDAALVGASARAAQAARVVDELVQGLSQAARVAGAETTMTRRELAAALEQFLGGQRLHASAGGAAVTVLGPEDLVETRFARIVVVGVDPGVFPAPVAPDGILTEELRGEINACLGPRLLQYGPLTGRAPLRADARDLWVWLELLAACQDELVVTLTAVEGAGEDGRSELVQELSRSLGGRKPEPWREPFASTDVHGLGQARAAWARGSRGDGAVQGWAGLDRALRRREPERLGSVERRASVARALEAPPFVSAPLGEPERSRIAEHVLGKVHSTSQLDQLGTCAFRYFASALLRLESDEVAALGPDAREEGSLAHAALELVYAEVRRTGGLAAARRDPDGTMARARAMLAGAREQLLREVRVHPFLEAMALEAARETALRLLRRDLDGDDAREPLAVEYRFDDRDGAPAVPLRLEDATGTRAILVRGSIDRVDSVGSGIEAIDYKRRASKRPEGRHFQLPLYLAVALRDFGGSEAGASWVDLRQGKPVPAVAPLSPEEHVTALRDALWARLDRVLAGDVAPDPEPVQSCRRCDYGALCRHVVVVDGEDES